MYLMEIKDEKSRKRNVLENAEYRPPWSKKGLHFYKQQYSVGLSELYLPYVKTQGKEVKYVISFRPTGNRQPISERQKFYIFV